MTAKQKDLFREAAELQGVTLTDFIVSSVHEAAVRTLEARLVLDLSREESAGLRAGAARDFSAHGAVAAGVDATFATRATARAGLVCAEDPANAREV